MSQSLLDRAIYSYADVDRLVGLTHGTARRWLEGYTRDGRVYEPILRPVPTGADSVTWGELVEARLLAQFRARHVTVQRLRPAVERLRAELGPYPLAQEKPFLDVAGRDLVRHVQDSVGLDDELALVVVRDGQFVLTPALADFQDVVEYQGGEVRTLRPRAATPLVVMDPARAFGQPAVRNVRTDVLAEAFSAGADRDELIDLYELSAGQVDDALRFELAVGRSRAA